MYQHYPSGDWDVFWHQSCAFGINWPKPNTPPSFHQVKESWEPQDIKIVKVGMGTFSADGLT